ncbi:hypothetical protein [Aeromonas cavernicola]|uniref:hypothetical protein n=1 Tax=Aeromonas cavernicola TaxID=1006623 RepID=UPI00191C78E1|nr:hypothetical protein [Aeromonas cavernicola]
MAPSACWVSNCPVDRVWRQAYQRGNVKVIASDAGITACHNGGTHMSFEDMGIIHGLADAVVLEATDGVMFAAILNQLIDWWGF